MNACCICKQIHPASEGETALTVVNVRIEGYVVGCFLCPSCLEDYSNGKVDLPLPKGDSSAKS